MVLNNLECYVNCGLLGDATSITFQGQKTTTEGVIIANT